jgi:hydrogenase-1 operon protein HyaF
MLNVEKIQSVGNVHALLYEIAARLEKLNSRNETGMIDLKSLPFARDEYEQLQMILGNGEVVARIETIGTSEVRETSYPGVWWVTHFNPDGDVVADAMEITFFPEIMKSQPEDVRIGLERLKTRLIE